VDWFTLSYSWTQWSTIENHNKSGISWPSKRLAVFYACTLIGSSTIHIRLHTYQYCFTQHNEQITLHELELSVCVSSSHHFFLLGYFPYWESNLHFHFLCSSVAPQFSYGILSSVFRFAFFFHSSGVNWLQHYPGVRSYEWSWYSSKNCCV
jgi:hypothetical protein